jgi:hypothetical protein
MSSRNAGLRPGAGPQKAGPSGSLSKAKQVDPAIEQLKELKRLNEQLKSLLREKYPDLEDQVYLGIAVKQSK